MRDTRQEIDSKPRRVKALLERDGTCTSSQERDSRMWMGGAPGRYTSSCLVKSGARRSRGDNMQIKHENI